MPKSRTEEQFPLLLFLVGDQEVTQNNKRLFGRGRFDGITSGATAIITEWPNYLSSCWVTAFICGVTLFLLTLMLTSCMTSMQYQHRLPRCVPNYQLDNKTIHLAHSSTKWTQKQLQLLDNITHLFPNTKIHLVLIKNHILSLPETTTNKSNITKLDRPKSRMVRALIPNKPTTLDNILAKHPNIHVTQMSYADFFKDTPLFMKWVEMNDQMRIFAIRIIQMWQYGGLSYDLLEFETSYPKKYNYIEKKLTKLIKYGSDTYETMNSDLVSIDYNGLHMECKTPCHAFFGRILTRLGKVRQDSTPSSILNRVMMIFCRAGVVDKLFCHYNNVILFK